MGDFRVRSFEAFDTINQDRDVGPVRVAGAHLQTLGGRNALIHFFKMENGRPVKSHVRIVRAKTTEPDLRMDEIALQYDDRLALGINGARERQELSINKAWQ
ncbi:MAG: hypothetical protein OXJ64_02455 [Boseongicola sp.]|nr:hypothetical protein [Boseongicola sp.]